MGAEQRRNPPTGTDRTPSPGSKQSSDRSDHDFADRLPYSSYRYWLVAADMNKDNRLDVVLTCPNGYVAELIGNGDGSFQSPTYYAVSAPVSLPI
jgi:hypothetical protein